ncbi:MAG: hypothetical protein M3R68_01875, partial [Acidobacteriota bacterium]|nr:hypothetical protein [Acidobacteriota bacterium]
MKRENRSDRLRRERIDPIRELRAKHARVCGSAAAQCGEASPHRPRTQEFRGYASVRRGVASPINVRMNRAVR